MNSRIALVTGGGSGVGRSAALHLVAAGWTVAIAGRRKTSLDLTAAQAEALGRVHVFVADVTDAGSVDRLFDSLMDQFGRLDLLFNNAGSNVPAVPLDTLALEDLRAIIDTNYWGAMLCARAALRVMKAQDPPGGRIINNGSVFAYGPRPNSAPYTSTKRAITGLTKSLTLDGRAHGMVCGQVDIGNAATEMSQYMTGGATQADGSVRPEPRIPVALVAETIVHMAAMPVEANIPFATVMASAMPLYGRG